MAFRHFLPKHPGWLLGTVARALVAVMGVAIVAWRGTWAPGTTAGMAMGIAAAAIVFVEALYPVRRRLVLWPLTTSERWLQFHVYGGCLAGVLVLLHVGFRWPAGRLGWTMAAAGAWTLASGILGV